MGVGSKKKKLSCYLNLSSIILMVYTAGWRENKLSTSDCCKWERVECNTATGRVIRLFLNLTMTETEYDLDYRSYMVDFNEKFSQSTDTKRDYWYLNASLFLSFEELKSLYLNGNSIAGCVHSRGSFTFPLLIATSIIFFFIWKFIFYYLLILIKCLLFLSTIKNFFFL